MLFKRYNIPSIWLRHTELSPLLMSLSFIYVQYCFLFSLILSQHPLHANTQCSSLYETAFVAGICFILFSDKSACLKQEPSRTIFYPKKKKKAVVMTNRLTHCCAHIATRLKDA